MMFLPICQSSHSTDKINQAIVIPKSEYLRADDGRVFNIIDWEPSVKLDEMVVIYVKVNVEMPEMPEPKEKS